MCQVDTWTQSPAEALPADSSSFVNSFIKAHSRLIEVQFSRDSPRKRLCVDLTHSPRPISLIKASRRALASTSRDGSRAHGRTSLTQTADVPRLVLSSPSRAATTARVPGFEAATSAKGRHPDARREILPPIAGAAGKQENYSVAGRQLGVQTPRSHSPYAANVGWR